MIDVGDVEDAYAAEAFLAHRVLHALSAAVETSARFFDREKEQVSIEGRVALAAGADERAAQLRIVRVGDVPHLKAVESALDDDVPLECEVAIQETEVARIRGIVEALGLLAAADELHAACGLPGVPPAGVQPDAGIRLGECRQRQQREAGRGQANGGQRANGHVHSHISDLG